MLDQAGYRVFVAADGLEALQILEQHSDIAGVVTDVIMPRMNGRELAERIRERHAGMPVLFVSGYPSHALTHQDLLSDGVDYLEKPYTATGLLSRLRDILDRP
jgi:CheY-like chemotaxis protein